MNLSKFGCFYQELAAITPHGLSLNPVDSEDLFASLLFLTSRSGPNPPFKQNIPPSQTQPLDFYKNKTKNMKNICFLLEKNILCSRQICSV